METFSALLALCAGEFTGHRWIPRTKASDAELWCFFDLRLSERLGNQSWGWWFETPSRSLWRHCIVNQERQGICGPRAPPHYEPMRPVQIGRHFADDILKFHFWDEFHRFFTWCRKLQQIGIGSARVVAWHRSAYRLSLQNSSHIQMPQTLTILLIIRIIWHSRNNIRHQATLWDSEKTYKGSVIMMSSLFLVQVSPLSVHQFSSDTSSISQYWFR